MWKQLRTLPEEIGKCIQTETAGATGISKFTKGVKGLFKGLGKRMPLIGSLLTLAFEVPNLYNTFKDEGLFAGLAETGKTFVRLGGSMLLGSICTALGGPVGLLTGAVGFMAGDMLMRKIVGKTHTEKKAEQKEQTKEIVKETLNESGSGETQNTNIKTSQHNMDTSANPFNIKPSMTPEQLQYLYMQLYGNASPAMGNDYMMNAYGTNFYNPAVNNPFSPNMTPGAGVNNPFMPNMGYYAYQ